MHLQHAKISQEERVPLLLFDYPGICRASYDAVSDITEHEWLNYNPENADRLVRKILDEIYEAFVSTGSAKVLVIADRTRGAFSPEIQKYIERVQFPRFASDTNLKFVATVISKESLKFSYASLWKDQLAQNKRFIQADFVSVDEARNWLDQRE